MPGALGSVTVCWSLYYMYFSVSKSEVFSGFTKQQMFHKTIIIAFIIKLFTLSCRLSICRFGWVYKYLIKLGVWCK